MLVEPPLDGLEKVFVLPARNPALLARGASILDGARLASITPIAALDEPLFLARETVEQTLPSRADIDAVGGQIAKVGFDETALDLVARGLRLGQGDGALSD